MITALTLCLLVYGNARDFKNVRGSETEGFLAEFILFLVVLSSLVTAILTDWGIVHLLNHFN